MGSTFVSADLEHKRGFWMRDGVLELFLRFLVLHIEDPHDKNPSELIREIRDQWLLASRGYFTGCVPVMLEDFVSTEEGRGIVLHALEEFGRVLARSEPIDPHTLNLMGMSGTFSGEVEVERLRIVNQAFIDLVEGRIGYDPSDTSFMPGSRKLE